MNSKQFTITLIIMAFFSFFGSLAANFSVNPVAEAETGSEKTVTTSELRLVDERGRTRALLSLLRGSPRLIMTDEQGEFRLELGLGAQGRPVLSLRDQEGRPRTTVSVQSGGAPVILLNDDQGRKRASLSLSADGSPALIMSDKSGKDRLAVWQEAGEQGLALADENGSPRAALALKSGETSLAFYGRDKKLLWLAPSKKK